MSTKALRRMLEAVRLGGVITGEVWTVALREVEAIEKAAADYAREDRGLGEMQSFDQLMAAIARQEKP